MKKYALFPWLDLFQVQYLGTAVKEVALLSNRIRLRAGNIAPLSLYYYVDESLELLEVLPKDPLRVEHDTLYAQGRLDHLYSEEELQTWAKIVTFPQAPDGNSEEVRALLQVEQPPKGAQATTEPANE